MLPFYSKKIPAFFRLHHAHMRKDAMHLVMFVVLSGGAWKQGKHYAENTWP